VVIEGACPACKVSPFLVAGFAGTMTEGHDTYEARAGCVGRGAVLGKLVVHVSTLFGIEEDRRVLLDGRARVY
jgi:hypothetical protein